jgi:hypothetical protein
MGEVLGAIGFATGAIGFLLTTLPKLYEKGLEFEECQDRLRSYKLELASCQSKIKDWEMIWQSEGPFDEETYRYLWSENYDNITEGRENVKNLSLQIANSVKGHHAAEETPEDSANPKLQAQPNDWHLWRRIASRLRGTPHERPKVRDVSVLERIIFTLFKNQTLAERIERLKKTTLNVTGLSDTELQRLNIKGDNRKRQSAILEAVRLKTFVRSLTEFMDALYEECRNTQQTSAWALELRPPERSKTVKDWDRSELVDIDFTSFLGHPQPPIRPREKRFRVAYKVGVGQISAVSENLRRIVLGLPPEPNTVVREQSPPSRKTAPLRHLFQDGFFDTDPVYKAWEGDRARLALGFANWTLLLWNTKWTDDLCCCGLRFVKLTTTDAPSVHTLTAERHDHCNGELWKLQKFGILLAEVILATPLRGVIDDGRIVYEGWNRTEGDGGRWERISRAMILQKLDDKSKSKELVDAVQFCLDNRSDLATEAFQPHFLVEYIESVFKQ